MAGLTVAVTGPTGEIGRSFIRTLERSREVGRIVGMARRPFDPAAHGWKRTEYRRGDVLDRASVEGLVAGADVVVHLAFVVLKASSETRHVNVEGSRNVFEATVASGAQRLVYSSSVAAYGFPEDLDGLITEDLPALGHARGRVPRPAHRAAPPGGAGHPGGGRPGPPARVRDHRPDAGRLGYRSGYYGRTLITRVGKLELRVPQDRDGRFSTEPLERYQRSGQALVASLAEMGARPPAGGAGPGGARASRRGR